MVLTEAFAAGTPVVASDIAGYRDVVRNGVDGLLVPRGDATALAEALRDLALDPARAGAWRAPRPRAPSATRGRGWPRRSSAPTRTRSPCPQPAGAMQRAAVRIGALPTDGQPRVPARRLPSLGAGAASAGGARRARGASAVAAASRPSVGAVLAVDHIGPGRIGDALVRSSPAGCCSAWR